MFLMDFNLISMCTERPAETPRAVQADDSGGPVPQRFPGSSSVSCKFMSTSLSQALTLFIINGKFDYVMFLGHKSHTSPLWEIAKYF